MPWCEECSRYWSPLTLQSGACPNCGRELEGPAVREQPRVPWHFTVLLVGLAVYLGWRLVQLVAWLAHKL